MAFCGLRVLLGGFYGYLYGVNLLKSASARANSVIRFKAFACAFLRAVKFTRPRWFLPCSNLRGFNFYEFTKTLEKI